MTNSEVRKLLAQKFVAKHVDACLVHFIAASEKFAGDDWDGVALKAGKFVEAVTKALVLYCGKSLPSNSRQFKAGNELRQLEQTNGQYGDIVRIVIPKACTFVYEIVNNRGGRHDAGEIDANEMDAKVVLPMIQWILAELVRFSSLGGDTKTAMDLIEGVTNKVHPFFEKIDGRTYVNIDNLSAPDIGMFLLYKAYPRRVARRDLVDGIVRHGASSSAAAMAVSRLKKLVDDDNGNLKLRANGRQKSESLLKACSR